MAGLPENRIFVNVKRRDAFLLYIMFSLCSMVAIGFAIYEMNWTRLVIFLFVLCLNVIGIRTLFWSKFRYADGQQYKVQKDGNSILFLKNGTTERSLDIADLKAIWIKTTDEGPGTEDVFWILRTAEGEDIYFPANALADDGTLDVFLLLPGFDYENFVAAMGCTENKIFPVWEAIKQK